MNVDMWSSEAYAAYEAGTCVSVAAGSWFSGFLKTDIDPDGAGHWRATVLPAGMPATNWGGSFLVIPEQSKEKEAAWAFLTYMLCTAKGQNDMFAAVDYFPAYEPAWTQIDSDAFETEKVIETDEGAVTWDLAYLLLDTSVSFSGYAEVVDNDINGLYCLEMSDCGEEFIKAYASALPDQEIGDHVINVHGFVHQYDGNYCIRVFNKDNITFLD